MISKKLQAITKPCTVVVFSLFLLMAGKIPAQSSPGVGSLLPGQNNDSIRPIEQPLAELGETPSETAQFRSDRRGEKMIPFLDGHPQFLYFLLTFMILLMSLGTLGIWLLLFNLKKLKQPHKIEMDPLTLETLKELKTLFVETQNSLFWLQEYLENKSIGQSQSPNTGDVSTFSRHISDSQIFEPDTSYRVLDRTKDSPPDNESQNQQISNSMRANELLDRGNALLLQGRYEAAIAAYEQSIALEADGGQAWLNRGCALFYLKEYEQAIASYDQALHRSGDLADAWYNRAGALAKLDEHEQAIACYERATQLRPDYLAAWHERGLALFHLQRYSEALTCFKQGIQLKPNSPEFRVDLGLTLSKLHQYQEAIACYDQAIHLKPNYAPAWTQKGSTLAAMQRYSEAIAAYDRSVKLNPNEAIVWNYLGIALAELQKHAEALAAYDQALTLKPNWPTVQNNRAAVLMKLQRYPEAIAACNQAIGIKPNEPAIWYNKACCYGIQGDVDRAIENLQQAIRHGRILDGADLSKLANHDSDFDPIRQDPRFQQIVQVDE